MPKLYGDFVGTRDRTGTTVVFATISGSQPLPQRQDLANRSPDGFEWGYAGSGPAQLALAVLAFVAGDDLALELYVRFKTDKIARIGDDHFRLPLQDVVDWITARKADFEPISSCLKWVSL